MLKSKNNSSYAVVSVFFLIFVVESVHLTDGSFNSDTNFKMNRLQKRQASKFIQCENGANGLFPHPFDCAKFLHCDRGHTFIIECYAGTVFNGAEKICDWPRNVNCGARKFNGNTVAPSNSQTNEEEPFRGEGIINIRTSRVAAHSQNSPSQYQYHQVQYRPQESQIRIYQHQNPRFTPSNRASSRSQTITPLNRPESNLDRIVFIDSPDDTPQFYFGLTNEVPNRASVPHRPLVKTVNVPNNFPELNVMTRRVGDEFTKYFSNPKPKTHQTPSSNAFQRAILLKITPQQFLDMNLVSKPVGNAFNTHIVNPKLKTVLKLQFSPKLDSQPKREPAPIDFITLVRQGTPHNHSALHQFPQINLMTPIVGNQFYRYFSFLRPKSTKISSTEKSLSNEQIPSAANKERNESQAAPEKALFHGEPNLNRKISSPLENFNRLYYKSTKKQFNETERGTESNHMLISDNLMQLLRPYLSTNASKAKGDDEKTTAVNSNRADVETFTPTIDRKHIQEMHPSGRKPTTRPTDWHVGHSVTTYRPQSRFPVPESPNHPPYHRSDAYDPNKIFFPGPHSQSHPMQY